MGIQEPRGLQFHGIFITRAVESSTSKQEEGEEKMEKLHQLLKSLSNEVKYVTTHIPLTKSTHMVLLQSKGMLKPVALHWTATS